MFTLGTLAALTPARSTDETLVATGPEEMCASVTAAGGTFTSCSRIRPSAFSPLSRPDMRLRSAFRTERGLRHGLQGDRADNHPETRKNNAVRGHSPATNASKRSPAVIVHAPSSNTRTSSPNTFAVSIDKLPRRRGDGPETVSRGITGSPSSMPGTLSLASRRSSVDIKRRSPIAAAPLSPLCANNNNVSASTRCAATKPEPHSDEIRAKKPVAAAGLATAPRSSARCRVFKNSKASGSGSQGSRTRAPRQAACP
mmetsp:Transcript_43282/g.119681  ORF Transcript_43282/g.119681 Transcript_43282/m.119681 type:complete len:256 (+) Transcript_43282:650-1417(+)